MTATPIYRRADWRSRVVVPSGFFTGPAPVTLHPDYWIETPNGATRLGFVIADRASGTTSIWTAYFYDGPGLGTVHRVAWASTLTRLRRDVADVVTTSPERTAVSTTCPICGDVGGSAHDSRLLLSQLERESMRVYVDAEAAVAEMVDPEDTMTVLEAIRGHDELVMATYQARLLTDTIVQTMRRAAHRVQGLG